MYCYKILADTKLVFYLQTVQGTPVADAVVSALTSQQVMISVVQASCESRLQACLQSWTIHTCTNLQMLYVLPVQHSLIVSLPKPKPETTQPALLCIP